MVNLNNDIQKNELQHSGTDFALAIAQRTVTVNVLRHVESLSAKPDNQVFRLAQRLGSTIMNQKEEKANTN